MLFSQPELAAFLSDTFECAWESVRPVPRISIDFGNGHTLERTLRGNIATYLCTSEGRTFDLLTGLMDADEYRTRLAQGLELFARLRAPGPSVVQQVVAWHGPLGAAEPGREGLRNFSKAAVELPLERELTPPLGSWTSPPGAPTVIDLTSFGAGQPPPLVAFSKFEVEAPLESQMTGVRRDASGLALDTGFQRQLGHRLAHAFLAAHPLEEPAALTHDVYRTLLHVDLDDPYLGLAPEVLGGEPGRH